MKQTRSLPALMILFLLGTGFLCMVAGCGDDSPGPEQPGAVQNPGLDGLPGGIEKPVQETALREVLIHVTDKETGKAVPGTGVRLFYELVNLPGRALYKDFNTNIEGQARFEINEAARLMVRTEYSMENTEFPMALEGVTEMKVEVATSYTVYGVVRDPQGKPIEGAALFLARFNPGRNSGEMGIPLPGTVGPIDQFRRNHGYDMELETETGKDGRFSARVKTRQVLMACAYAEGFLCPDWRMVSFDATEGEYEPIQVDLLPTAQLNLSLFDARNRPMADNLILIFETPESKRTRKDWERIFDSYRVGLRSGPEGVVEARVPAGMELAVDKRLLYPMPAEGEAMPDPVRSRPLPSISLAAGESRSIMAMPHRTVRLQGKVIDQDGSPVPGARVEFPVNTIETSEEGSFGLLVPYNLYQRMACTVSKEGYGTHTDLLPEIGDAGYELALEITLERKQDLHVTTAPEVERLWLLDQSGMATDPILSLTGCERLWETGSVKAGQGQGPGRFLFRGINPGKVSLVAQSGSFHFARLEDLLIERTDDFENHLEFKAPDLAFPGDAALEGKVIVPEGMNPQRIEVILMRNDAPGVRRWNPFLMDKVMVGWGATPASLEDGSFYFDGIAPGRYAVAAAIMEWDARVDAYMELEITEGSQAVRLETVTSKELGSLRVTVTDSKGKPVPGVGLLLVDPVDSPLGRAGNQEVYSITGPEGTLLLDHLLPGRYGISLSQTEGVGYLLDARALVKPGACTEVAIVLR